MSENIIPFHINNNIQRIGAESLEGEFEVELHCLSNGPVFLLRPDAASSVAGAAAAVAAGNNTDFLLAAAVGNPTKRKLTDSTWFVYAAGDCVGLLKVNDDIHPSYGV